MTAASGSKSSTPLREDAFRRLLVRVSERLDEGDVEKIVFLCQVPADNGDKKNGLAALITLERRGNFSAANTEPLVCLMEEISRHDIADYVRAYRPVSRVVSLPAKRTAAKLPKRPNRSKTESQGVKIVLSSPDNREQSILHASLYVPTSYRSADSHPLSVPQSEHDRVLGGKAICPEGPPQSNSKALTKFSDHLSATDQLDSDNDETKPEENSEEDDVSLKSLSEESHAVQFTLSMSPVPTARSKSCERFRDAPKKHKPASKCHSFPHTEKKHRPLLTSLSAPGNIPSDYSSEEEAADSDSSDVLMMKPPPADEGEVKEPHSSPTNRPTPEKDHNSHRDVSHWKILEGSWLRGRRGRRNSGKGLERTTQCTWCVKRESVLKSIWNHQHLNRTQYPTPVPIDIECGPQNPHVSLLLYHYGLFEDANKSMTLHVKVVVPDDCPPLPTDATFTLTWVVRGVTKMGSKELGSSKKPNVRFNTGILYIHKFLPHSVLQQNNCETLEICVHLTTAYSIRDDYTTSTTADIPQKCSDKMLLSFKTVLGNRKIAQEIGRAYHQFGCSLLDDEDGTITSGIAAKENYNAVAINDQIFSLWLQGQGRQPVQWPTLIHTLREINMHDLASHMEQNLNS